LHRLPFRIGFFDRARLLAYVTGTVNQELLLRNEYLVAENRILKGQIKGRLLLTMKSGTIRAKAIGSCFLRRRRQEGKREQCGVENDSAAC
jgi:uncharacterized membrane protein